jgi:hypothetical protein
LLLMVLAMSGCSREDVIPGGEAGGSTAVEPSLSTAAPAPPPVLTPADSARLLAELEVEFDSVRNAFNQVSSLRAREVAELRQDRNAEQIAVARRLGLRAAGDAEIERLVSEDRLVALGDSTEYWVLRPMEHSVPYVTPDTRALLEEIGRRFHARLDSVGLPRYRMKFTSALRTAERQAALRRVNSNASATVSAHEFGTTVDISYERFAAPVDAVQESAGATDPRETLRVVMLDSLGVKHGAALRAELGRAIASLRDEGALHVMMENTQTVYHMTLGRGFEPGDAVAARD